jgi:hypothetical protein
MTELVPVVSALVTCAYVYFIVREALELHAECGRRGLFYFFWYRLVEASIVGRDLDPPCSGCSPESLGSGRYCWVVRR